MPSTSSSTMNTRSPSSALSTIRTNRGIPDETRRQITKLKTDLEAERNKVRQLHRDKVLELKKIQENFDREKRRAVDNSTRKLQAEHEAELRKIRENTHREKDIELRQVLKYKDEELKSLKQAKAEEIERSRWLEDELRKASIDKNKSGVDCNNGLEEKLRHEISLLKEQKQKAEEMYRLKASADMEKGEMIRKLKADHETEIQKVLRETKRESSKGLTQVKSLSKSIEEKNHELALRETMYHKLESEKETLEEELTKQRKVALDLRRASSSSVNTTEKSEPDEQRKPRSRKNSGDSSSTRNSSADEKIRRLKHRNAELISIARQLEDKAKQLQKEKTAAVQKLESPTPSVSSASTSSGGVQNVEHIKKAFARQRAKDKAEHARTMLSKNHEIEELKKQVAAQSQGQQQDKLGELENIIKQNAKERLALEKSLTSTDKSVVDVMCPRGPQSPSNEKYEILLAENNKLKLSMKKLEEKEQETIQLKTELEKKKNEHEQLVIQLDEKQKQISQLEGEKKEEMLRSDALLKANNIMKERVEELEDIEEECEELKQEVSETEELYQKKEKECEQLKKKLQSLVHLEEDLHKSKENFHNLEREHETSLIKLKEREKDIENLHQIQEEMKHNHQNTVNKMEENIRGLKQQCMTAEKNFENLNLELTELKRQHNVEKRHIYTQTSRPSSPVLSPIPTLPPVISVTETQNKAPHFLDHGIGEKSDVLNRTFTKDPQSPDDSKFATEKTLRDTETSDILADVSSRIASLAAPGTDNDKTVVYGDHQGKVLTRDKKPTPPTSDDEIDELSRRLYAAAVSSDDDSVHSLARHDEQGKGHQVLGSDDELAELGQRIKDVVGSSDDDDSFSRGPASRDEDFTHENDSVDELDKSLNAVESLPSFTRTINEEKEQNLINNNLSKPLNQVEANKSLYEDGDEEIDESFEHTQDYDSPPQERLRVFIARYSYDPYQHSPNDNPEAELAFQAGDYLYVFGEVDDDGFFLAELTNGERGLVPSNFVEQVADEDDMDMLPESMTRNGTEDDVVEEESDGKLHEVFRRPLEHIPDDNLGDIEEEEEDNREEEEDSGGSESDDEEEESVFDADSPKSDQQNVPSPKKLALERQFSSSALLSWKAADVDVDKVKGYAVYLDGDLKTLVPAGTQTKALIEGIDSVKTHRVCVRTVTKHDEQSWEQEATLAIGKDAKLAPEQLTVTNISATSANLSWFPCNSNYAHEILVNGVTKCTLRPGLFQHSLTYLEANTAYNIKVRARHPRQVSDIHNSAVDNYLASEMQFSTLKGGVPEAPVDVEVLLGPRHGNQSIPSSLEVSWLPVTLASTGISNGTKITGYKVYISGLFCAETNISTVDSLTIAGWQLEKTLKYVTGKNAEIVVRTQYCDGESEDSNVVVIPLKMFGIKTNDQVETRHRNTDIQLGKEPLITNNKLEQKPPEANKRFDEKSKSDEKLKELEVKHTLDEKQKTLREHLGVKSSLMKDRLNKHLSAVKNNAAEELPVEKTEELNHKQNEKPTVLRENFVGQLPITKDKSKELPVREDEKEHTLKVKLEPEDKPNLIDNLELESSIMKDKSQKQLSAARDDLEDKPSAVKHELEEKHKPIIVEHKSNILRDNLELKPSEILDEQKEQPLAMTDNLEEKPDGVKDIISRFNALKMKQTDSNLVNGTSDQHAQDSVERRDENIVENATLKQQQETETKEQTIVNEETPAKVSQEHDVDVKPISPRSKPDNGSVTGSKSMLKHELGLDKDESDYSDSEESSKSLSIIAEEEEGDEEEGEEENEDSEEDDIDVAELEKTTSQKSQDSPIKERTMSERSSVLFSEDDGFKTDDDVMDLLGDEGEEGQGESTVTFKEIQQNLTSQDIKVNDLLNNHDEVVRFSDDEEQSDSPDTDNELLPTPVNDGSPGIDGTRGSPISEGEQVYSPISDGEINFSSLMDHDKSFSPVTDSEHAFSPVTDSEFALSPVNGSEYALSPVNEHKVMHNEEHEDILSIEKDDYDSEDEVNSVVDINSPVLDEDDIGVLIDGDELLDLAQHDNSSIHAGNLITHHDENLSIPKKRIEFRDDSLKTLNNDQNDVSDTQETDENIESSHDQELNEVTNPAVMNSVHGKDSVLLPPEIIVEGEDDEERIRVFIALYDYDPVSMSPNPDAADEELTFNEGDLIQVYGEQDEDGFFWGEAHGQQGFVPCNMVSEVQIEETDEILSDYQQSENGESDQGRITDNESALSISPRSEEQPIQEASSSVQQHAVYNITSDNSINLERSVDYNIPPDQYNIPAEYYDPHEPGYYPEYDDVEYSDKYHFPPVKMVALFDYDPHVLSPNPDAEVELKFNTGDIIYVFGEMDEDGFYHGEISGIRGLVPSNFLEEVSEDVPDDKLVQHANPLFDDKPGQSESVHPHLPESQQNGSTQKTDSPETKKKKSFLSKGKQMFKKMAKGQQKR